MKQSPSWKSKTSLFSQKIPLISYTPKVHYRNHNSPLPVPVLSQSNPVHTSPPQFLKFHLNIIFQPTLRKFLEDIPSCFYASTNIHINNAKRNTMLILSHILGYRFRSTWPSIRPIRSTTFYGIYNCNFSSNGNAHISLLQHCASNVPDDGHVDRNR